MDRAGQAPAAAGAGHLQRAQDAVVSPAQSNGLIVDFRINKMTGTLETDVALEMIAEHVDVGATVGADKGYDNDASRAPTVEPHAMRLSEESGQAPAHRAAVWIVQDLRRRPTKPIPRSRAHARSVTDQRSRDGFGETNVRIVEGHRIVARIGAVGFEGSEQEVDSAAVHLKLSEFECDVGQRHCLAIGPEQRDCACDCGTSDVGFAVDDRDVGWRLADFALEHVGLAAVEGALQGHRRVDDVTEEVGLGRASTERDRYRLTAGVGDFVGTGLEAGW